MLQGAIDRLERIIEVMRLAVLVKQGAMGPSESFLRRRIQKRRVRSGNFLQGLLIGCNSLLEPRRAALPVAERANSDLFRPGVTTRSRTALRFDVGHHSDLKPVTSAG
jgi:hypothetical protein